MKIYMFYHSIVSDWNHGNAHFLRGIVSAFRRKGHFVAIFEPSMGWSLRNLVNQKGVGVLYEFNQKFPLHFPTFYNLDNFDPEEVLADADIVLVHEWNEPALIKKLGQYRSVNDHFQLYFHDTHHRAVTMPDEMQKFDLKYYDGVLVFRLVLKEIYEKNGWAKNTFIWHEAADTTIFQPLPYKDKEGDLVWIGNWGDNERTDELLEFIIEPVEEMNLKAVFYGVRYPKYAVKLLEKANIEYRDWLPNHEVPEVFSRYRFTIHVPRRPYVQNLPGIPTIRPFEAMACGIPLITSTWYDSENLFTEGKDYLMANNKEEMKKHIHNLLHEPGLSSALTKHALKTINTQHTCNHRANEFFDVYEKIKLQKKQMA